MPGRPRDRAPGQEACRGQRWASVSRRGRGSHSKAPRCIGLTPGVGRCERELAAGWQTPAWHHRQGHGLHPRLRRSAGLR